MKHSTWNTLLIGAGLVMLGTVAGGAWAGQPSQADMDFCNQKAAETRKGTPVQPGAGGNQPGTNAPAGRMVPDSSQPGTPVQPGTQAKPPGNNPTGGRITDSSQPGTLMPPPAPGMAPIGQTDGSYRAAYLTCLNQRSR
jgi:hypothetical protein